MTETQSKTIMDYFLREADPFFLGRTERGLLFEVCGNNFYSVRLTLIGADEDPPEDAFWEHADLRQNEEGGYIFCAYREEEPDAETQDEASPAHILFELPFREYETRVDYYDGTADAFGYAPWDRLTDCCRELAEKADCPFIMLNDREQELLPLIRELAALGDWEQSADKDFPLLKKLTTEWGCEALIPRMEHMIKLELEEDHAGKSWDRELQDAVREVSSADSEPLWRWILDRLKESQDSFPKDRLLITDPAQHARYQDETARITQYFRENGYSGSFPLFEKEGFPAKRRVRTSYGKRFQLNPEEEKRFFMHFHPWYRLAARDALVYIRVTAGFVPSNKGSLAERPSGLFYDGGKSLAEFFSIDIPLEDLSDRQDRNGHVSEEMPFKKLNRIRAWLEGEKRLFMPQLAPPMSSALMIFMGSAVLGLVGFVLMALLALLFSSLILFIAGKGAAIPGMIRDIPWGRLLLFSEAVFLLVPALWSLFQRIRTKKS